MNRKENVHAGLVRQGERERHVRADLRRAMDFFVHLGYLQHIANRTMSV
jgi:hypothetical protein